MAEPRAQWFHIRIIALAIAVKLLGVLWYLKVRPAQLVGWTWNSL